MKNPKIYSLLLPLLIFSSLFAQNSLNADFDSFIKNVMDEKQLPGLAIPIIKDDLLIFVKGYGVRKFGQSDPVNKHTLFQAASLTKTFTATLMGLLVEQGKIKWDDPVKKYIADFNLQENYIAENLTIRDVLQMCSGITGGDTLHAQNRSELIYLLRNQPLSNAFRVTPTSWNLMYTIAGYIEEIIYEDPWEEIVKNMIFNPLEMKDTYTDIQGIHNFTNNVATPHVNKDEKILPIEWTDFELYSPAEGIVSNVLDLSKWTRLIMNHGKFGKESIIKKETLDQMLQPQMIVGEFFKNIFNPTTNFMTFGIGWFLSEHKGYKVIEMGGAAPGTSNLISMIPSENIGLVIQTNMNFAFKTLVRIKFHVFDSLISLESSM